MPENAGEDSRLSEDALDHFAVDIREAVIAALEAVGQLLMIEAEAVQDGGVLVVDVHGVLRDVVGIIVRLAVGHAAADTAAGRDLALGADVTLGIGVALAAAGGVLLGIGLAQASESGSASAAPTVTVLAGPTGATVVVAGSL